jgi:hypothetical protein
MPVIKQLSLFLRNEPGVLARLCEELAQHKINIQGLSVSDTVDHAVVRLLCDNPHRAAVTLGSAGLLVIETDVLVLNLPDKPGVLADLARKLAKAKVNIEYAYGTTDENGGKLVLRVNNTRKAMRALKLRK